MLRSLVLLCLASSSLWASVERQYPEDRIYTSKDRGYTQYGAPSLHKTGKYALTFDDGPHPIHTPRVLDSLKAAGVKATFFIITSNVTEATFPLVKRMLDEGHLVASHGKSHDNSNTLPREVWKAKVKQSFIDLARFYKRANHPLNKFFYRFPYAAYGERKDYHHINTLKEISRELIGENCIQFAFWDIDSGDWIPGMTGPEVLSNFKASNEGGKFITYKTIRNSAGNKTQVKVHTTFPNPFSGGVVLEHDIQKSTEDGIKLILTYVKDNHLDLVRLDEVEEFKVTKHCEMKQ